MEATLIVKNIVVNKSAYGKTVYLLENYKDLKNGLKITNNHSSVLDLLDKAIELISDDEYIDTIKYYYLEGKSAEETAFMMGIDTRTFYRKKKRLVRRLSVILYGDEAL